MIVTGQSEQFNSTASMVRELQAVLDKPGWTRLKMAFGDGEVETHEFTRAEVKQLHQGLVERLVAEAASKPKAERPSAERVDELKALGWTFRDKKDAAKPI